MSARMKKHNLGGVLVLLIFAVFAVSILLILLNGADIVQKISERDGASFERRTAAQYLTMRVRQADEANSVSVRTDNGKNVLVLAEEIERYTYETMVYCHEGYLCEMFCEQGLAQEYEFGEKILPLEELRLSADGNKLQAELSFADGREESLIFGLHSERSTEQ